MNGREPAIVPGSTGHDLGPVRYGWTERDPILYALGIGARQPLVEALRIDLGAQDPDRPPLSIARPALAGV